MQSTIFDISLLGIHIAPTWYGAMYALGFFFSYLWMRKYAHLKEKELDDLLFYVFLGVVGGGRMGYVLLYNISYYLEQPIEILRIWQGGMSFHGGFIGVLLAVWFFSKKYGKSFFFLTDILSVIIPVALGLGRIGNWINRELPGYAPYSSIFPMKINGISHFPSPLFEMLLEGALLFIIMFSLWRYESQKTNPRKQPGYLSGVFLLGYGAARIIAEQFRLPDAHIGYLLGTDWMTLGMLYTLPMIMVGIVLVLRTRTTLDS